MSEAYNAPVVALVEIDNQEGLRTAGEREQWHRERAGTFAREEAAETAEDAAEEVERLHREVAKQYAGEDRLRREKTVLLQVVHDARKNTAQLMENLTEMIEKGPDAISWTQYGGGEGPIHITTETQVRFSIHELERLLQPKTIERWLGVAQEPDAGAREQLASHSGCNESLVTAAAGPPMLRIGERRSIDAIEAGGPCRYKVRASVARSISTGSRTRTTLPAPASAATPAGTSRPTPRGNWPRRWRP